MRRDVARPPHDLARSHSTHDDPEIDAVSIMPDRLTVRGVDLLQLIDTVDFTAAISHVLTARRPAATDALDLDRHLCAILRDGVAPEDEALAARLAHRQSKPEAFLAAAIAAGLTCAAESAPPLPEALRGFDRGGELAAGLRVVAALPRLLAIWRAVTFAADFEGGFGPAVLCCLTEDQPGSAQARLFDVLLVALHGGFGIVAPTTALSRFSASTYAGVEMNLLAGLTGSGPAHVGACSNATRFLEGLVDKTTATIRECVAGRVRAGGRIPGFGHPLLERDPRPGALERHVERLGCSGAAFDAYRTVCEVMHEVRGLPPNIDAVAAAILLDLRVPAMLATAVFLFARMPTMLAHALQKKAHPPFGQTRSIARERLSTLPTKWI